MGYRCDSCGNRTRFDVYERKQVRGFHHYSLAGEVTVEEEEVLALEVERVVCRWCGSTSIVEEEAIPEASPSGDKH